MSQAVGIGFGLEFITVSTGQNDSINNFKHTASADYKEFSQHLLQSRVQNNLGSRPEEEVRNTHLVPPKSQSDDVEHLLRRELEAVIASLPDSAKPVAAITIPYHWNDTVRRAMFKAAEGAKIPLAGIHMVLKLPRALDIAYQLDTRLSEDDYFFVVVDYNTSYLHILICETAKDGGYGIVEGQVQLPHLGEKSAAGRRNEALEAVKRFLSLTTVDGTSSTDGRPPRKEIKAVLVSGDASSDGVQEMRDLLKEVFGESLIFSDQPPSFAGALGAARAAKQQVEDPKTTKDFVSMPYDIPDEPKPS